MSAPRASALLPRIGVRLVVDGELVVALRVLLVLRDVALLRLTLRELFLVAIGEPRLLSRHILVGAAGFRAIALKVVARLGTHDLLGVSMEPAIVRKRAACRARSGIGRMSSSLARATSCCRDARGITGPRAERCRPD